VQCGCSVTRGRGSRFDFTFSTVHSFIAEYSSKRIIKIVRKSMHLTMTLRGIARRRSGHSLRIWSPGVVASDERIGNKSLICPINKGNWKTGKKIISVIFLTYRKSLNQHIVNVHDILTIAASDRLYVNKFFFWNFFRQLEDWICLLSGSS